MAFNGLSAVVEIDEKGCLKIRNDVNLNLVSEISTNESPDSYSFSVKVIDRLKAIDLLCKILGIYEQKSATSYKPNISVAQNILKAIKPKNY